MRIQSFIMAVAVAAGLVACATKSARESPSGESALSVSGGLAASKDECKVETVSCDAGTCAKWTIDSNSKNEDGFSPECLIVAQGQTLLISNTSNHNRCVVLPSIFESFSASTVQINAGASWEQQVETDADAGTYSIYACKGNCPPTCHPSVEQTINGNLDVTSKGGGTEDFGR